MHWVLLSARMNIKESAPCNFVQEYVSQMTGGKLLLRPYRLLKNVASGLQSGAPGAQEPECT